MLQTTPDVKTFLDVLFPSLNNEFIEARLFHTKSELKLPPIQRFYSNKEELLGDLPELLAMQSKGYGIYVGVCPRKEPKGTKEAVSCVFVLWADLDAKGFEGDKQKALEAIQQFKLKPTMIIDSGHGYHAYWLLKEAETDMARVESCLKGIANAVNADSAVCEVSRVMRLPGSVNNKEDSKHLPVSIIELNQDSVYGLDDFGFVMVKKVEGQEVIQEVKDKDWIAKALAELKNGNRNNTFFKLIGRFHRDKHTPETVLALLKPHVEESFHAELKNEIEHLFKDYAKKDDNKQDGHKSLVDEVLETGVFLFHNQYKEPYIVVKSPYLQAIALKSKNFEHWLKGLVWEKEGVALSDDGVKQPIGVLVAMALYSGPEKEIHVRVAEDNQEYFYDLGRGKFVHITSQGWAIVNEVPVYFKQSSHQKEQVAPVAGGDLRELLKFINLPVDPVKSKDYEVLLLVWIVTSFIPGFPHPALTLHGAYGSAKSTLCALLKSLIDPSVLPVIPPPKSQDDFIITCTNHWLLPLDNLGSISPEFSDTLCRAITGTGYSKRQLYTDSDEVIYCFKRIIVINGINLVVDKPDLLSRSLMVELEKIPNNKRLTEKELWAEFALVKGNVLGAIFDVLAKAINEYPKVTLRHMPRMADFMLWGVAIAKALGYQERDFVDAYLRNIDHQHQAALESSVVAQVIIEFMKNKSAGAHSYTPSALYEELNRQAIMMGIEKSKSWPKDANWLWRRINVLRTNLETIGIIASQEDETGVEKNESTPRRIVLTKVVKVADSAVDAVKNQEPSSSSDGKTV